MRKRIAFVIQRYHSEISGGAEALVRSYVQRLKDDFEITILTSCCLDYNEWRNDLPEGEQWEDGVRVIRFLSDQRRDAKRCADLTTQIYEQPHQDFLLAANWLRSIGPECAGLLNYIANFAREYDLFVFSGYLYFTTTYALPLVAHKAVLIPTAHEEDSLLRCNYFKGMMRMPLGMIYLTQTERELVQGRFDNAEIAHMVAGSGVQLPCEIESSSVTGDYFIYIGRVDETKDCGMLLRAWEAFRRDHAEATLVLVGQISMEVPQNAGILCTGFVSEAEKYALLAGARALILPSRVESLSIVTLEAMALGIPVLLRRQCAVLREHAERSGAGLCFDTEAELCAQMDALDVQTMEKMCTNGKIYIQNHYQWDKIIDGLKDFLQNRIDEAQQAQVGTI